MLSASSINYEFEVTIVNVNSQRSRPFTKKYKSISTFDSYAIGLWEFKTFSWHSAETFGHFYLDDAYIKTFGLFTNAWIALLAFTLVFNNTYFNT